MHIILELLLDVIKSRLADQHDEIDVELVGGDPSHWQTNVFTQNPKDKEPLYGVFGEIEDYTRDPFLEDVHKYTIDWNKDRIIWSVDGSAVRTLNRGKLHVTDGHTLIYTANYTLHNRGHEIQGNPPLPFTSRAYSTWHLGCELSRWDIRMGKRSYRLGPSTSPDVRSLQECHCRMSLLT